VIDWGFNTQERKKENIDKPEGPFVEKFLKSCTMSPIDMIVMIHGIHEFFSKYIPWILPTSHLPSRHTTR